MALEQSRAGGAKVLSIVNVVGSSIARLSESCAYTHAGPEIGVASTKTFLGQLGVLLLLALSIAQKKGSLEQFRIQAIGHQIAQVPVLIQECLARHEEIRRIGDTFKGYYSFVFLGRGYNFPIALEGALKLKEIALVHADGYPAAEMKHGPIALVDEYLPVVFVATRDAYFEKILSNIQEIKARQGRIIAIVNEGEPLIPELAEFVLAVPVADEIISPILSTVMLQLLSYEIGVQKGLDVDQPRNLAALAQISEKKPASWTLQDIRTYLAQFCGLLEAKENRLIASRGKDAENPFRKMMFVNEEEMEAVLGSIGDDPFIQAKTSLWEMEKEAAIALLRHYG